MRRVRLSVLAGLLFLIIAARDESCSFSAGPNGLCATLRLGSQDTVIRVGDAFRVRINADGCSGAAGCPCVESAAASATWRSENSQTATVDSTGLVRGRQPGTADIVIAPAPGTTWDRTRVQVTVVP